LADYLIDFNQLLGESTPRSVAYAVCYIESRTDQRELVVHVGSDDQAVLYLNEQEIYRGFGIHSYAPDQDVITGVSLKAGLNALVFKVVNGSGDWQGSVLKAFTVW
jgi:hypothetical protein